jgi:hypothetical protein
MCAGRPQASRGASRLFQSKGAEGSRVNARELQVVQRDRLLELDSCEDWVGDDKDWPTPAADVLQEEVAQRCGETAEVVIILLLGFTTFCPPGNQEAEQ